MSLLFLDTSALLKLYLPERGSRWLGSFVVGNEIALSELALYESATVLRRRYLEGGLTRKQASILFSRIWRDAKGYRVTQLRTDRQFERVVSLAFNVPSGLNLRALDSIHIAAAQIAQHTAIIATPPDVFIFISADVRLLRVAQAQGFVTENPEDHP